MEKGNSNLKKERSFVRTFLRFCPSRKIEKNEQIEQNLWNFIISDDCKILRAGKKSSISKTRCCTVTDSIYKEDVCNSEIYRKTGLQQHVLNALDGISTNFIVCGPHRTGKTHLLIGSQRSIGLVLQTAYDIFAAIRCYSNGIHLNEKEFNNQIGGNFDKLFLVKASVLEIGEDSSNFKLDNVRDLINPENPLQLIRNLGGELGYLIKGEPEHLFESEEKLVASILSAVSRKKVLDAIRRERLTGREKKRISELIQNTLFGDFGEKWIKDDVLGSLIITITVESVDRSELENNIGKSEKAINSIHVNSGSIRFFEISSCITASKNAKSIIPMFGLLDLAFEIRRYCYTNEKTSRIDITNISSFIASNIIDSNLIVLGTLSTFPDEKKCCIRPILFPYDNQSKVQPHSIFDTLQFIEYIGNSMKFSLYPQRNCFKKPLSQSKLIDICRKVFINDKKKPINHYLVIRSDRGLWQSESSGRVTRIIRLLTFINHSLEGSGVLRILMSGNDNDILRIYCENIIGSDRINLEEYPKEKIAGRWFQNENFKIPEKDVKQTFLYYKKKKESKNDEFKEESKSVEKQFENEGTNRKEMKELKNFNYKVQNLDYSEDDKKQIATNRSNCSVDHSNFYQKPVLKYDEILLSERTSNKEIEVNDSEESDVEITNIFDSKIFENSKFSRDDDKDCNLNFHQKSDFFNKDIRTHNSDFFDQKVGGNHQSINMIEKNVEKPHKSIYFVDESVGKTRKSIDFIDESVGKTHKSIDFVDESVGKTHQSIDFVDESIGKTHKSIDFLDKSVGKTHKSIDFIDESVGKTHKSIDFVDKSIGKTHKSIDFIDESIGKTSESINVMEEKANHYSNEFDPVRQYEELLEKTRSLNKLQKSIMESHKQYFKDDSTRFNMEKDIDTYSLQFQNKKPIKYYPLANKKAIEASQKAIEASKKAIEASKGLYDREINHRRDKVHEVIPASKNFPQVDIYAPPYDSDIDYDLHQTPKDLFLNRKSVNKNKNGELENQKKSKYHCNNNCSDLNLDICPCCEYMSKKNKCRCHYTDASVNFVGISETSVNTDKSLFEFYEPGAGVNEKIKANGRSWDIFVNIPHKFTDVTALGFANKLNEERNSGLNFQSEYESDLNGSNSFLTGKYEDIQNEIQIDLDSTTNNIFDINDEFSNCSQDINNYNKNRDVNQRLCPNSMKSNIINLTEDNKGFKQVLNDFPITKNQTKNLKHSFPMNLNLFRPLYTQNSFKKDYQVFNRTRKKNIYKDNNSLNFATIDSNLLNGSSEINIENINDSEDFQSTENSDHSKHFFSNDYEFKKNSYVQFGKEYSEKNDLFRSNISSHESINNNFNYEKTSDVYLQEIEKDISNQINNFSNVLTKNEQFSNIRNSNSLLSNSNNINFNLENQHFNQNSNVEGTNLSNYKLSTGNVVREVGCCSVKYIFPFPKEFQPKVFKGIKSYQFPYLKSLY